MEVINIILFIILILALCYTFYYKKKLTCLDEHISKENEYLSNINKKLKNEGFELSREKAILEGNLNSLTADISKANLNHTQALDSLKSIQDYIRQSQENMEKNLQKNLEYYCDSLEVSYAEAERLHDEAMKTLKIERVAIDEDLKKLQATRKASIEAFRREEEIKQKLEFYCLTPKTADINDIQTLEGIKYRLNNPRILSMLIWSTYFQKDMTALCNRVLGLNTVTGIYKITNQQTNKCYIGQSVDVSKRWKDHAKCGLGIDAPAGNKLYKDMQDFGIWNFSWELIETCPREQLNEKERYYIQLYQSQDYGYNSTKGNK